MRKSLFIPAFALALLLSAAGTTIANAKTILTDIPRASWTKYGINPWKLDTDNDGVLDSEEIFQKTCPTSADPISLTDKNCKRGTFNLKTEVYTQPVGANFFKARDLKNFQSCTALSKTLQATQQQRYYPVMMSGGSGALTPDSFGISQPAAAGLSVSSPDYSTTNIQVQGVDEGDTLKTDGQHIFTLAKNDLFITSADPNVTGIVATIPLNLFMNTEEFYLAGSKLVAIGTTNYGTWASDQEAMLMSGAKSASILPRPYPYNSPSRVIAAIFDISDINNIKTSRVVEFSGNLVTTRLTNGYTYLVLRGNLPWYGDATTKATDLLPQLRDMKNLVSITDIADGKQPGAYAPAVNCTDVQYLTPGRSNGFLEIFALPVADAKAAIGKKIIWGVGLTDEVYVSPTSLYITSVNYEYRFWRGTVERTELYKFNFAKNAINFVASQTIPGQVLNQFSMDEDKGLFRLVTTEQSLNRQSDYTNHLIVLSTDLSRISSVDGFAPTEKIYSARFIGNRVYVVTYRQIDPFIVFDLTNSRSPQYIGDLKIPGYSTYLQAYDATHIIGIGKNTATGDTDNPGFVWTEGVKLGLFDVTNPNIPTQLFSTVIGDRGTDSPALTDHHAFLFSKEKNLLAFPVSIATFTDEQKNSTSTRAWEYGQNSFQGLIVYNLDLASGFKEIGRITHAASTSPDGYAYGSDYWSSMIKRSLYIGDKLYVASDKQLTIHNLANLVLLGQVKF